MKLLTEMTVKEFADVVFIALPAYHKYIVGINHNKAVNTLHHYKFILWQHHHIVMAVILQSLAADKHIPVTILWKSAVKSIPCTDVGPAELTYSHIDIVGTFHNVHVERSYRERRI